MCLQPTIFSDLTALQVHVAATGDCALSPSQSRGLLALHLRTARFLCVTVSSSQSLPHSDSQHVFLDHWHRVSNSHLTLQHSVTSLPGFLPCTCQDLPLIFGSMFYIPNSVGVGLGESEKWGTTYCFHRRLNISCISVKQYSLNAQKHHTPTLLSFFG